jgi:hypothetical protein
MEQLEFDFGADFGKCDVTVKEEVFYYVEGNYGVEAKIATEEVNGDVDYRVIDVCIMNASEQSVSMSDAGVTHDDIIRAYEIEQELKSEEGIWG